MGLCAIFRLRPHAGRAVSFERSKETKNRQGVEADPLEPPEEGGEITLVDLGGCLLWAVPLHTDLNADECDHLAPARRTSPRAPRKVRSKALRKNAVAAEAAAFLLRRRPSGRTAKRRPYKVKGHPPRSLRAPTRNLLPATCRPQPGTNLAVGGLPDAPPSASRLERREAARA